MPLNSIAVLMTCYNRKHKTIECLKSLFNQKGLMHYKVEVFLLDDGSTDGTTDLVKKNFPKVRVFRGDGTLFWCGGMRIVFGEALKNEFEFYLWLNDDTILYDRALEKMLATYNYLLEKLGNDVIVAGSLHDAENHKLTYGGCTIKRWWRPTQYKMLQPNHEPQPCDLINGNCVLISKEIAQATGNMSNAYKHGPGDKDYALRAVRKGFTSWICPGYAGTCSRNILLEKWKDRNLTIQERMEALNHPVILARVEDWIVYTKKYHKLLWPIFYFRSFIRLKFPRVYLLLKSAF